MTEMFSITRASLRLMRAAWQLPLPAGAKLVLLCILSHYNDARGIAFPSLPRLAKMCGVHKRTVQGHIAQLEKKGLLQVGKLPGISNNVYRIHEAAWAQWPSMANDTGHASDAENLPAEVAFAALAGGDFSAQGAQITTHNGKNEFEPTTITDAPAQPVPEPVAPLPLLASSSCPSSLFLQALQNPQDQAALQAWQQVRQTKKRPALPNALQCQQLLNHAAALGKPLGWIVQVMALNDWALFDPAWLHNQRPPPRLPTVAAVAPEAPPRLHTPPEPAHVPATPEQAAQAQARIKELLAQWRSPEPAPTQQPITPCGVPWADNIIASVLRGEPVGFAALDMACSVAKVSRQAVRAAARPAQTWQAHPVG